MESTLLWLQEHGSLAAGLLGFVGVIVTLLVNAWLSRRQDRERWLEQRRAVRKVVIADLQLMFERLRTHYEHFAHRVERDTWHYVVLETGTEAYHQILPQMGYLDPDEVSDILECYRGYWDICRRYRYEAEEVSAQWHFRIAADRHERLLDRCAKLVNEAHPVIVALQRQEADEGRGNGSKRLRSKLGRMLPVPG